MTIISWLLRLLVAGILFQTLFFKFSGAPESVYIFTKLGLEPWGRIGSGVVELIAVVLLLIPATVSYGAFLALGVISGAIMSHPDSAPSCQGCGAPLDRVTLGGPCPRCVALGFFASPPPVDEDRHRTPSGVVNRRLGDYELIEEIARGGMGVVYRAEDMRLGRQVAIKFLPRELLGDSAAAQRFEREAPPRRR